MVFDIVQVDWLNTEVFYPDLPYRFHGPGPSQYIYMQISVLITDNLTYLTETGRFLEARCLQSKF